MYKFSLTIVLILFAATIVAAQDPCPQFELQTQPYVSKPGEVETFSLLVPETVEKQEIAILWTVTNGELLSGQGTTKISVTSAIDGKSPRATVEVRGPGECVFKASDINFGDSPPKPKLIYQFEAIQDNELGTLLGELMEKVSIEDPTASLYIVNYGRARDVAIRERTISESIRIRVEGVTDMIVLANGGDETYEKLTTRIWIVPAGADTSKIDSEASKPEVQCPKIEVIGPPVVIQHGDTMEFRVETEAKDLSVEWRVDKGEILESRGLGIVVGGTDQLRGQTLKATVFVSGLPENCQTVFSDTGVVSMPPVCNSPIDEFGELARDDLRGRIDNLIINLQVNPHSTALIISYGPPIKVSERHEIIRNHIELRKYPHDRFRLEYRAYEDRIRTRMWIVPEGADTSELK